MLPITAPINEANINGLIFFQCNFFLLNNNSVAAPVPILPWSLFVPNTYIGGIPLSIKAGTASKPPPPTKVSRNPAITAMKNKNINISREKLAKSIVKNNLNFSKLSGTNLPLAVHHCFD